MNSKQRAYLRKISATIDPIFQVGKSAVTPEITAAIEIIKLNVLKNCLYEPKNIAEVIADRTRSTVVHVIGRKIVLYRPAKDEKDRKIILP